MDDEIPIVATSKHIVVNTITAADDYLKIIQPSAQAVPVYDTNTYYSTVEFSKTISEDEITKVINTQDVVTQVIVTESLPHGRMPMSMAHDLEQGSHELSPSDDDEYSDEEPEVSVNNNYIKKTNVLDINPTRIDQQPNAATAMPLHLYATKTYLTTFTYFTTLLQNGGNIGGEISSTIVDSHTRVIENVITESIAPSLIPTDVLDSISKSIIDDSKSDLKTRIRLRNGQKVEITAANILKPVDYATETKVATLESNDLDVAANDLSPVSVTHDESENIVSESSEEDIVHLQEPVKVPTIEPKPKPASGSLKIPSLLNSISMPSLPNFSALGPVINAMAGILTSNFGTQTANKVLPLVVQPAPTRHRPDHEQLPQPLPLFSQESQDTILGQTESKNKVPLYIPIHPNGQHHNPHHAAIMGSGIPISPGEIITANSDVIVGRPAVIGPKLPSHINKPEEIAGMAAPPPFVPLKTPQRSSSFVKDIKNGNINQMIVKKDDDYIGPVPPREMHAQNKPIPLNGFPRPSAPQNLQKIQPILPPMMRPHNEQHRPHNEQHRPHNEQHRPHNEQHRPANILIPKPTPTQESQLNNHYIKINHHQPHKVVPVRAVGQDIPKQNPHAHHHFNNNQHAHHHHNNKHHHQQHPPQSVIQPNIIEIQKIPEVYSTDLPIITVNNRVNYQTNKLSYGNDIISHELPEILDKPTNGQPLLVDIQPSQVANVVIPHDSSSVLVFGGVHEAHKVGQYFNDPPPHANAEVGIKSVNLFADINGNKYDSNKQPASRPGVQYDVKDNIIVASENMASPSNINLQVSPLNVSPTVHFTRPHEYASNSVHSVQFSPSSVISFYPETSQEVYRRPPPIPTHQQIVNQQKQQQIAIDNQLKQKHMENQKRIEVENQKRYEFIQRQKFAEQQKRKEQEELQKRREYEEQQKRKEMEQEQRRREYEEQQRQKQIELQRKQEFERQKVIEQQKRQQDFENQKRVQQQQEMKNRIKNQIVLPHRPPVRPEIPHPPPSQNQANNGFIVLTSNYNSHDNSPQNQQNPFIPMPDFKMPSTSQRPTVHSTTLNDFADSDSDGPLVQESINRPKLPSGENHSIDDDEVKDIEDFDNFVYHRITAGTTESPTTEKPVSRSTSTTRRISTFPISTERISITTNRNGPIFIPKPYPNHQFENLPNLVNDLQYRPPSRPTLKGFQRLPVGPQFKPNTNNISQNMKPPVPTPPKISRRPTHPFGPHKTTFRISMPIDPMPDDSSVVNNLQTEVPFNPIYTQSSSTSTSTSKPNESEKRTSTTSKPSTTASTTQGFSPMIEVTTKRSELNIGEVEPAKKNENKENNNSTVYHGYDRGKDDFDLIPPSNKNEKPYHTIVRASETTTVKSSNNISEFASSELETMKPPPIPFATTKAPTFVEVINMKPPTNQPLRPYVNLNRPTISLSKFTPSSPDTLLTTTQSKTTATTYRPPFRRQPTTVKPVEEVIRKQPEIKKEEDINATPVLPTHQTKSAIDTTPSIYSSVLVESSVRKESNILRHPNTERRSQNRTKINVEQVITSTRWVHVTNTKTITLSKTKTELINRSHGTPIYSTSVHTVYETITETETLLKPTVITTIQPTKTIIRETVIPTYSASTTTEEIVEGFVSQEDLDEFIINYDEKRDGSIVRINSNEVPPKNPSHRPIDNDSILVVVTDKKNQHKINLDSSIISPSLYNHSAFSNEIEDVSRGEEDSNDGAGHILLGGILIATPPHLNKSHLGISLDGNRCYPECSKVHNEFCKRNEGIYKCECKSGFARMFDDRPCKRELL